MRDYKEVSRKAFNDQASNYDISSSGEHAKVLYKLVLKNLNLNNKDCSILDVGCGTGELLYNIYDKTCIKECKLHGIDIAEKMIDIARNKMPKVDLIVGDAEYLPYNSSSMDYIICNDSFHHYPSPNEVLYEFSRVLKDGGELILGEPITPFGFYKIMNFYIKFGKHGDFKMYRLSNLIKLVKKANFKNISFEKTCNNSVLITAIK